MTRRRSKRNLNRLRSNELYSLTYRTAWRRISPLQKREQPNIAVRLHGSIRHQIKEGETDSSFIVSEALNALDER